MLRQQRVERDDTVGTGQPRQPGRAVARRKPVKRVDTAGTGQPRQPGRRCGSDGNELSGCRYRRSWATSPTWKGCCLDSNELSGSDTVGTGQPRQPVKGCCSTANELSGTIPSELGNLANLERLLLAGNRLSGSIPPELGNLANLEYLYLEGQPVEWLCTQPNCWMCLPMTVASLGLPSCATATANSRRREYRPCRTWLLCTMPPMGAVGRTTLTG